MVTFLTKKAEKIKAPADVLDQVMDRLKELAFIDDRKFAMWWVEQRTGRKPKGSQIIKLELRQKGIAPEIIEEVLSGTESLKDEGDAAKRAIEKKLPLWEKYPIMQRKKKIYEFLARRGFPGGAIARTIDWATQKDYNTEAYEGE